MVDEQDKFEDSDSKPDKMFTLKKWNSVAMWSWDVECEICAICRVQVMDACLRCQSESSKKDVQTKDVQACVVVWGECNHSFHHGEAEQQMPFMPIRMVNSTFVELNFK